jgi:hypothetical protein
MFIGAVSFERMIEEVAQPIGQVMPLGDWIIYQNLDVLCKSDVAGRHKFR